MSNPQEQMDGSCWGHPEQPAWTQQIPTSYMPVPPDDGAEHAYLSILDPSTAGTVPYDPMMEQPDLGYQYDEQAHDHSGGVQDPNGIQSQTVFEYTDTMS